MNFQLKFSTKPEFRILFPLVLFISLTKGGALFGNGYTENINVRVDKINLNLYIFTLCTNILVTTKTFLRAHYRGLVTCLWMGSVRYCTFVTYTLCEHEFP